MKFIPSDLLAIKRRAAFIASLLMCLSSGGAATISSPSQMGPGSSYVNLQATDQSNPFGFDVTGVMNAGGFDPTLFTLTETITSNVTLATGYYESQLMLAGTVSGYGTQSTMTVSTELDLAGNQVPGS